jgi:predicted DNA-binding transcriptional regulator YafY
LDAAIERLSERLANASGVSLDVRVETPPSLAAIQDAISAFQDIRIAYRRPYASEPSTYVVTPIRTYLDDGVWYLDARRDDGEHRTFRLQRISAVERLVTDATSATSSTQLAAASMHTSGRRTVRVRIVPGAEWVVGHYRGRVERRSTQGSATEVIAVLELFDPVIARLADIAVRVGTGFAVVDDDQLAAELHAYIVDSVHRLDQLGG